MLTASIAAADHAERERLKAVCVRNLEAIGKAIIAYRADHDGEMPDWLSDLHPKYLQDAQLLRCPADKKGGAPAVFSAYKDPVMACSYIYEFNPLRFVDFTGLHDLDPSKEYTFKQIKTMDVKYFGQLVPTARCRHHAYSPNGGIDTRD